MISNFCSNRPTSECASWISFCISRSMTAGLSAGISMRCSRLMTRGEVPFTLANIVSKQYAWQSYFPGPSATASTKKKIPAATRLMFRYHGPPVAGVTNAPRNSRIKLMIMQISDQGAVPSDAAKSNAIISFSLLVWPVWGSVFPTGGRHCGMAPLAVRSVRPDTLQFSPR